MIAFPHLHTDFKEGKYFGNIDELMKSINPLVKVKRDLWSREYDVNFGGYDHNKNCFWIATSLGKAVTSDHYLILAMISRSEEVNKDLIENFDNKLGTKLRPSPNKLNDFLGKKLEMILTALEFSEEEFHESIIMKEL